ncbi:MAG: hypothetical protein ACQR33_01660 [Candidatus Saccharibacteria bacterium]
MLDELQKGLETYLNGWRQFAKQRHNEQYFADLKPTAVAWKFTDRQELMQRVDEIRDLCEQIHFGWINERWAVCAYLKDDSLAEGVRIVKLMERRPGSTDPVGLDHVDFYTADADVKSHVEQEDIKWTEESNGQHCNWISVWFEQGEAKLRTDTVFRVCADEMMEYEQRIIGV